MPHTSTHAAIAALSDAELLRDGALAGVDEAAEWSGFSVRELYDLMNSGALPWVWRGKVRLIPRRALAVLLAEYWAAQDEPKAKPQPGEKPCKTARTSATSPTSRSGSGSRSS